MYRFHYDINKVKFNLRVDELMTGMRQVTTVISESKKHYHLTAGDLWRFGFGQIFDT